MLRKAVLSAALALLAAPLPAALAAFPYAAADKDDPTTWRLPTGADQTPNDLQGKLEWMYAATAASDAPPVPNEQELDYVRGAHIADAADVDQAWRTTTGRPDVTIAVLDSGIEWNNQGAMRDLRKKTRISSTGEVPVPLSDRTQSLEPGVDCATYGDTGRDLNDDGVFNVLDYACDSRVSANPPNGVGPTFSAADGPDFVGKPMLDPQDILIAFSDGDDDDSNGYPDDMVGWDFVDDDNDPYDDVQYGHGTGEARDSVAEANNGGELGTCPNCMAIHMRVGTSFIADVNRFAQAVIYAVDNDVEVVQEALGTLNKSRLGRDAVDYAWRHGVTTIASAADEAAQHNNWPSSYPHVILVNSNTHTDPAPSYLEFNGCTNFNAKIDLAIPSVSCSSDATGRASGMAGLIYSAALNAHAAGDLTAHPSCDRVGGAACLLSAGEVKQLMASGILGDTPVADDVNFAQTPLGIDTELTCRPAATLACMDPFLNAPPQRVATVPVSYPARRGHDQFYGYGRVNMNRVLDAVDAARVPPDVEITGPEWYAHVDPDSEQLAVHGSVWARGRSYTCQVLVAPGGYPGEQDFEAIDSTVCDGTTARSLPLDGVLGTIATDDLEAAFPPGTNFAGPEHGPGADQPHSGRPNLDPYGFVVKVVATLQGEDALTGQDRRKLFLHQDADMLDGFPKQLDGDAESSPVLADLDGDNRNELIVANSDGLVHAWRRDGSELPGFPARTDDLPRQTSRAFTDDVIEPAGGAVLATPAVGDLDRDGEPEIVVADMEGKVYAFAANGDRVLKVQTDPEFSGKPLGDQPQDVFVNRRKGNQNRTQLGFIGSPVLADLDGDDGGHLEIVAAAMDRHTYAWNEDGSLVPGWPVLTVDRAKVESVDPQTHQVTFKPDSGAEFDQGALIDTPAVGDLDTPPDGRPEVVVGSNESYEAGADGGLNAGGFETTGYEILGNALSLANGRLFAIKATGEPDDDLLAGASPYRDGWPFKVGILQAGILPLVGEGVTGSPVIGVVRCNSPSEAPRVGTIPAAGIGYLVNPDGQSCYGRTDGKDRGLASSGGATSDQAFLAAFGHPAFGPLGPAAEAFYAPVAGVVRAADVVAPEYQGGEDQLAAWNTESGTVAPNWPAQVNDLQFLTGPSIADIDGLPGEEIVAGTSSMDLQAFTPTANDVPGWPKLTGDWTVANPTIGTFGELETDDATRKVVIGATRSGKVLAYATDAGACAAASWPHFHHDNWNSGDSRTDAIAPGTPTDLRVEGGEIRWTAAGDDLLCGDAEHQVA
ncbi:MAG: S8 family serine peptidase, partial [Actinomycetota bacterium]|nr:S8 family serine peptidase [Actinomycetota bacterium]